MSRIDLSSRQWAIVLSLLLVLAVFAVFSGVRHNGFVNYDDPCYLTLNEPVQSGLTPDGVRWSLTAMECGNWHPTTWVSHMADTELFGLDAGAHHLVGVAWHAAAALALFWALFFATNSPGASAFVAFLFALHPLHVQSVAWASERKDLVSTFFAFLAIAAYVSWVRRRAPWRYAVVLVLFILGLGAKPMLVTLPFVLLLLDRWPLSRSDSWFRLIAEKIPFFVLSLLSSIVTVIAQRAGEAVVSVEELALAPRLANAVVSYWVYIGQMLWPTRLSALYPFEAAPGSLQVAAATLGLVVVTAAAFVLRRRAPYVAMGWLWYLGTLVPVIGVVQVGAQAHADRYTYLPLVGLFIVVAWAVSELGRQHRWIRTMALPGAIIVLVACSVAARQETARWLDTESLFRRAVEVTSDNKFARYYLAKELAAQGKDREAVVHYAEAVRLMPERVNVRFNYGNALKRLRRFDEAARQYDAAARLAPDDVEIRFAAGTASALAGRRKIALEHFLHAVRLQPDLAAAHLRAATMMAELGDTESALERLRIALRLDPDLPQAAEMLRVLERNDAGSTANEQP